MSNESGKQPPIAAPKDPPESPAIEGLEVAIPDIHEELTAYLNRIEALDSILPAVMLTVGVLGNHEKEKFKVFVDARCTPTFSNVSKEGEAEYQVPVEFQ